MKMPNLDGIEAARRIYAERPIPIVMLTAYADPALVERAIGAGVFALPRQAVPLERRRPDPAGGGRPARGVAGLAARARAERNADRGGGALEHGDPCTRCACVAGRTAALKVSLGSG